MTAILRERPDVPVTGLNSTGADIAAKLFVTGSEASIAIPGAITDPVYGLTRSIAVNGRPGSVLLRGRGICTAGTGGVIAGQRIMPAGVGGRGVAWAANAGANASVAGIAMTAAAEGSDFEIELLGPGAMAQGA